MSLTCRASASLVILAFSAGVACAANKNDIVWIEYPASGVVLGQGYNLLTDNPATGVCVNFRAVQDPSQETTYKFEEVTSKTESNSKLDISASGSLKMAVLTASASLGFLTNEEYSLETKKFLLDVNVVNSALFASPGYDYKLGSKNLVPFVGPNSGPGEGQAVDDAPAPAATPAADNAAPTEASRNAINWIDAAMKYDINRCGHGFVAAVVSGASVRAFMTWSNEKSDSLTNIKGSLKADIAGIFSVSGSINAVNEHNTLVNSSNISVYKSGGAGANLAYSYDTLKTNLLGLPKEALSSPKPLRIGVLPYSALPALDLEGDDDVNALYFQKLVAAYFLAIDAYERSSSVIDAHFTAGGLKDQGRNIPIVRKQFNQYLELNSDALKLSSRISLLLRACRDNARRASEKPKDDPLRSKWREAFLKPQWEGQQAAPFKVLTLATARSSLTSLVSDIDAALQTLEAKLEAAQVDLCSPTPGSIFDRSRAAAIELTSREISMRPLYFGSLSPTDQRSLGAAFEVFRPALQNPPVGDAKKATDDFVTLINNLVRYHVRVNESSALFRRLCENDVDHPLCEFGQSEFVDNLQIDLNYFDVDLDRLRALFPEPAQ